MINIFFTQLKNFIKDMIRNFNHYESDEDFAIRMQKEHPHLDL